MSDEAQSDTSSSSGQHKPHITWSDTNSKSIQAVKALSSVLPSLPASLSSSSSPASALLHDSSVSSRISALLRRPGSGAVDDGLCAWLYDTFRSSDPDLHLVVLRFLPALAGAYLSRAALHQPLAGFESVLLAIYAHETAARSGQPVTATIPDMAHPSVYHESSSSSNKQQQQQTTELHLAVISPTLEPHGTVRSTRRARIVGVALELYYSRISQIPVGSKVEFCEFCRIWSGWDPDDDSKEKGRINLPWELLQPILRILGHCLDAKEELFRAALGACRCMHARAMRDINPKAMLATMSLVRIGERAADKSAEGLVDHTEIAMTNEISF